MGYRRKTPKVNVSTSLEKEDYDRFMCILKDLDRSQSDVIRRIMKNYIDNYIPQQKVMLRG